VKISEGCKKSNNFHTKLNNLMNQKSYYKSAGLIIIHNNKTVFHNKKIGNKTLISFILQDSFRILLKLLFGRIKSQVIVFKVIIQIKNSRRNLDNIFLNLQITFLNGKQDFKNRQFFNDENLKLTYFNFR
jgi:hypothetical protein